MGITHLSFFLIAILLLTADSKIIQVPPISSDQSLTLRLQQTASIDGSFSIFGNLTRVYRKEVAQVVDGKEVPFSVCAEQPPQTSFSGTAVKHISQGAGLSSSWLVYDFKRVQYPRNLIDIALQESRLYYVLGDGQLKVAAIGSGYTKINDVATHKTSESSVAKGNIVIIPGASFGVFINHNQAALFGLKDQSFAIMQKYQIRKDFMSAVPLEGNYFAAAYGDEGLRIYSLNSADKTLKIQYELNKDSPGIDSIDIRDIAYDSSRKILFMVDYASGLMALQVNYSNALSAKLTSSTKKLKACTLIYHDRFADELYLNCRELYKFRISSWPTLDQKVLPKLEISIREITSTSKIVALVGREIFQLLVADRKAAIYQDRLLDKLILTQKNFVSANENTIMVGNYEISAPSLRCSAKTPSLLGGHRLVLKMTAECNQDYFTKVGFQPGQLNPDDKCIYTVYKQMTIWQPAVINTRPFMVIGVMLALLGAGTLIWWCFSYLSLRKMRNNLQSYQHLEQQGRVSSREQKKSNTEDNVVGGPQVATNEKLVQQKKEQIELQSEELHDIQ